MPTLRKLTLAVSLCALLAPGVQAAEPVKILASLPITYGLSQLLLKDSGVEVQRAAATNLPGSRQNAYFTGRGAEALAGLAVSADAVIGLRSLWPDDSLYPLARRSNIRIVEIDAARPVDGVLPGIALQPGVGGLNSQPWLASNNMGRMADVMAADLVRLVPTAKGQIDANLAALKQQLLKLSADSEARLAKADNVSVVSLSDRFAYLTAGLNLDTVATQVLSDEQWDAEQLQTLTTTLKDNDVALVLDHRQPPEAVKAAISAAGGKLLVLSNESEDPIADLQAHMNAVIQAL
jgi:ABC-type Zn uptake system ZnuABC Zn-binding protein ZnuA